MRDAATLPHARAWFQPAWPRVIFAFVLAAGGFLLPQSVPLVWYPLNHPGDDILYLEITCASDVTGNVQIKYDVGLFGSRPFDQIDWPISPTTQTYTYTFPLPDAPIVEMRVSPPKGGTLTIRRLRIIDRRGQEYRRFTADLFRPQHQIAAIKPIPNGWQIISAKNASDPYARIEMYSPILASGAAHRNLLRCLLSWGYLSLMLWIILLAGLFTFFRPQRWRELFGPVGFMAGLALMFSVVGNRGLIKNSWAFSRYVYPSIPPDLKLEFDLASTGSTPTQLFWDVGHGINGADSNRQTIQPGAGLQVIRFPLPSRPLKALRYDPRDNAGSLVIRGIRVVDAGQRTKAVIPLDTLQPFRQIAALKLEDQTLHLATTPHADDPITNFSPRALELVNRCLASAQGRSAAD
jgi:hypothetical protein